MPQSGNPVVVTVPIPVPMTPRVFTIPPSVPFLPTLIGALKDGRLVEGLSAADPLALADATIFLPTRRACRLARDAFLDVLGVDAAVLPRIVPIGDIDEDELVFADMATGGAACDALDLPPALGGLERRFLLARLVRMGRADRARPGSRRWWCAIRRRRSALADDLARLMDDMTTRDVPWQRLDGLVPDDLDEYWQLHAAIPADRARDLAGDPRRTRRHRAGGATRPPDRRRSRASCVAPRPSGDCGGIDRLHAGDRASSSPPSPACPMARWCCRASTPSSTRNCGMPSAAWRSRARIASAGSRPPAIRHACACLPRIGIARRDVAILAAPSPDGRETLASEALRPAATTDKWLDAGWASIGAAVATALAGVTVIHAANAEDEALAVAVALREALPNRTRIAALVTPDRALARRVAVTLRRWNIAADDFGRRSARRDGGRSIRAPCRGSGGRRRLRRRRCWRC